MKKIFFSLCAIAFGLFVGYYLVHFFATEVQQEIVQSTHNNSSSPLTI